MTDVHNGAQHRDLVPVTARIGSGWAPRDSVTAMAEQATVIREARVDDEAELWPMASALATSYEPTRERFRAGLRGITEDPRAAVLVAEHDGSLVGYVHVLVHEAFHADGLIGWVEELMVGEHQRGTGCGRALMAAAEQWATGTFDIAYLAVATRRAEGFYRSIGYDDSATYFKKSFR